MKRLTNQVVSFILIIVLICSMSVTAFAATPQQVAGDMYHNREATIDEETVAEALRNQCETLSSDAKAIFLRAISSDPQLVACYRENVDPDFIPTFVLARASSVNDPLKQLERNLKALQLPTAVIVSLMAVGSGFVAAIADGPLVFGDAYLAVTAVGAATVLGLHWGVVSPQFPNIVNAFKECFKDYASVVTDVFSKLKSEAKTTASAKQQADEASKKVSKKVKKKGSNDTVDLDQFKDKNGRTPKNKNSGRFTSEKDSRYTIEKDTAGHTGYDGSKKEWKLFLDGERIASLNKAGKIVGK